jgi:hypothetical protein
MVHDNFFICNIILIMILYFHHNFAYVFSHVVTIFVFSFTYYFLMICESMCKLCVFNVEVAPTICVI